MTHVKMRSFILPGQTAQLLAERMPSASEDALTSIKLSATVESRTVATARLEIGPKEGA